MNLFLSIWISLGTITAVIWLIRNFRLGSTLRMREHLGSDFELRTLNFGLLFPRVSVLVAAKDEEANIEACLRDLLEQDYPNFEVIAIDDRSRDATPAILEKLKKEFGDRLRVLTIRTLPEGWYGKTNAMREGVAASTGQWLLFTDADCRFTSRSTISAAMHDAMEKGVDYLTVIPELEVHESWERILQPVCSLVLMYWFQPRKVNDPRCTDAYANGAFMLMSRPCHDAIGGHAAVRAELNEDIHMARAAKKLGLRLRVLESGGHYTTRMYASFTAAMRGWSRIFAGSLSTPRKLTAAAILILVTSVTPWIAFAAGLVGASVATESSTRLGWTASATAWGLAAILMQICFWRLYSAIGFGKKWSLLYAVGALGVVVMMLNALSKVAGVRSVTWRGTTYRPGVQAAE